MKSTMSPFHSLLAGLGAALFAAGLPMVAVADAPVVVASIKPIHSLLAGIMERAGRPRLLMRGGASPHTSSLRPSQARALAEADVVVWVGEELESFLTQSIRSLADDAYVLELSRTEGIILLPVREGGTWNTHDHGGEAGEAHVHHDDGHEQRHGEFDMHLWLDPVNAAMIADAMAKALALVDPERAGLYRDNAIALRTRLRTLDTALKETLAPVAGRGFIVFHNAWQYFDTRYGLRAAGAITVSPDHAPGAARLTEIREKIASAGAECVFAEPQVEPRLVRALVADTGVATGTLDPLGAMIEDGPDLYFTLMRANAEAFRACFDQ